MWSMITSSLSGTDVFTIMSSKFSSLLFVAFRSSLISICRRSIVNEVLAGCRTSALGKIDHLLVIENNSPNTVHESEYMEYSEKYLTWYRNARAPLLRRGGHHWQQMKPEELAALDPYSQALLYMANTRAYFRGSYRSFFSLTFLCGALTSKSVAFKRFSDMVPLMIDQELLRGLDWNRGLNSALTKGLGITGPGSLEKAKEYLQEPPDVKSRRESLLKKLQRLEAAWQELRTI